MTKEDIEELGWEYDNILISEEDNDQPVLMQGGDGDIFIQGYELTIDDDKLWYCMYENQNKWVISKRWYRNSVGQSWRDIYWGNIPDKNALKQLMEWLQITIE